MAEGLFIRVTNAATEGESVLLDDIFDATDGAAHQLTKAGAVYVAAESSIDLAYTGDVARSFENGCIRGMINAGTLSASFGRGDSAGEVIAIVCDHGTDQVVSALGKVIAVDVISSAALQNPASITITGADAGAIVDGEDISGQEGQDDLAPTAAGAEVAAGEVLTLTLNSAPGGGAVTRATVQITFATADA